MLAPESQLGPANSPTSLTCGVCEVKCSVVDDQALFWTWQGMQMFDNGFRSCFLRCACSVYMGVQKS